MYSYKRQIWELTAANGKGKDVHPPPKRDVLHLSTPEMTNNSFSFINACLQNNATSIRCTILTETRLHESRW